VISRMARNEGWIDERFWATMVCNAHELVRRSPHMRDEVRTQLEQLANNNRETVAGAGLKGMLEAVDASRES
jgi:hypothetical protein